MIQTVSEDTCGDAGEGFSVAFDPLDGSSIVDTNFTVGTIFGVWPGDKLLGVTGRDQVLPLIPALPYFWCMTAICYCDYHR